MDDSPPSMARSQSEVLTRPSSVPKKKVFGLSLLSEEPEHRGSLKSGIGSSADVSEEDAGDSYDEFVDDTGPLTLGDKRWTRAETWSTHMFQGAMGQERDDGDGYEYDDDYAPRDGWDQHGCDDDFEEDRVEDVDRDARRCHSLSDLEYLEEVIFALHFAPWNAFSNHVVFFPFPFDLRIPRCVTGCDMTRFDSRAEARAFEEAAHPDAPAPAQTQQNFPRRTLPTPSPVPRHPGPPRARSRSHPKP